MTRIIHGTPAEIQSIIEAAFGERKLTVVVSDEEDLGRDFQMPEAAIHNQDDIEQLLIDGLDSGPSQKVSKSEWDKPTERLLQSKLHK